MTSMTALFPGSFHEQNSFLLYFPAAPVGEPFQAARAITEEIDT